MQDLTLAFNLALLTGGVSFALYRQQQREKGRAGASRRRQRNTRKPAVKNKPASTRRKASPPRGSSPSRASTTRRVGAARR